MVPSEIIGLIGSRHTIRLRWSRCGAEARIGYGCAVREAELWVRLNQVLPDGYASVWAEQVVLAELDGRTVSESLAAGVPCKRIWRAVWAQLELPQTLR